MQLGRGPAGEDLWGAQHSKAVDDFLIKAEARPLGPAKSRCLDLVMKGTTSL